MPKTPKLRGKTIPKIVRIKQVAKPVALAVRAPVNVLAKTYEDLVPAARTHFAESFQLLTAAIGIEKLTAPQLADLHSYAKDLSDTVDEAQKVARARLLELATRAGTPNGDKGSLRLDLGDGRFQPVTVARSGTDPKKFESAIRAKGHDVSKYMDTKVTFVLKDETQSADLAIRDGVLTVDEAAGLNYEPSFRVDRPRPNKEPA